MLAAAREAGQFAVGKTEADLARDRQLTLALLKYVEIVGEAGARVGEDTRAKYSHVPWADLVGMRNRLVHAYFDVDLSLLAAVAFPDARTADSCTDTTSGTGCTGAKPASTTWSCCVRSITTWCTRGAGRLRERRTAKGSSLRRMGAPCRRYRFVRPARILSSSCANGQRSGGWISVGTQIRRFGTVRGPTTTGPWRHCSKSRPAAPCHWATRIFL